MKIKTISIDDEQDEFINESRRGFNLSKFVRARLKEYIEMIKSLEHKEVEEE